MYEISSNGTLELFTFNLKMEKSTFFKPHFIKYQILWFSIEQNHSISVNGYSSI